LGFQVVEVNASDARGKSDSKATSGIAGDGSTGMDADSVVGVLIVCCPALLQTALWFTGQLVMPLQGKMPLAQTVTVYLLCVRFVSVGKLSNVVREMVTSTALAAASGVKRRQVLVMDEVDGMSGEPPQQYLLVLNAVCTGLVVSAWG
jgi:DNA polymerase III delta prime subunit